ncbi:uncharacterized protein MJAP1_000914 [Malassezia japonica]|uniref:Mis18 domain-containing protein n=1 Tax=Malassezia japonica TaxID=223818 RepID=A0AAF0JEI7_9BASI|nr:uncharacterized protein MJAP1_000914 [Malassezia japonica]WFD37966.1 hypothetical protein MJAP1_000914 [Malassezia japonica]
MRPTTPTSFVELQESVQDTPKRAESAAPVPTADKAPPALVFQCARCLTVVGDSFSWITAQRQLSMIVLREAAEKVAVVGPVITSSEPGQGLGSTYSVLQCTHCTQHLGRQYHETPRALDELRSAFSFHVDAIIVYQLGSTSATGHPSSIPKEIQHTPDEHGKEPEAKPEAPRESASDNASEMDKIRTLLMVLGERLMRVEQHLHLSPTSNTEDTSRWNV